MKSAVLLADPGSTWQVYTPWQPDEWIAVTLHDDHSSRWWSIVERPAGEWSIYEVEQT